MLLGGFLGLDASPMHVERIEQKFVDVPQAEYVNVLVRIGGSSTEVGHSEFIGYHNVSYGEELEDE
eukprot:15468486-Alexandrium_andersonii.AAC.1